jgi:uncharacterized protein DUF3467
MPDKATTETPIELKYERTDDFVFAYANNAYFESSAWDLKIIFGQLDQPVGEAARIRQNIAITVPWAQAKLVLYYLRLHVEANELQNGKVSIREDLLPPEPTPPSSELENNPIAQKMYELVRKLRADFIASL